MAERILSEARIALIKMGFEEEKIQTIYRKKEKNVAQDTCRWSQDKKADAILMSRRGRTSLEDFFMGQISSKMVEYCRICRVWIMDGAIDTVKVLLCIDNSENALRAVDHAGFMLSGTDCRVTLFYSMRHLRHFLPLEVLEDASDLDKLWKEKAGKQIAPYMKRAREMLLNAGLSDDQIATRVVDGSRSPANDILKEARDNHFGTIVLGRRGLSGFKEFFMGSVTTKVLGRSLGLVTWIVQ